MAESRKSATLRLTQPIDLSLKEILERCISYISTIADTYETVGKADGGFYNLKSIGDILLQYCDKFNNASSYDTYWDGTGEMPLEVSERGKSCLH